MSMHRSTAAHHRGVAVQQQQILPELVILGEFEEELCTVQVQGPKVTCHIHVNGRSKVTRHIHVNGGSKVTSHNHAARTRVVFDHVTTAEDRAHVADFVIRHLESVCTYCADGETFSLSANFICVAADELTLEALHPRLLELLQFAGRLHVFVRA